MRLNIPQNIYIVLESLREAGFRAVPVGGCVRDLLLGKTPHDWDVATSATPGETADVFSRFKTVEIGQSASKYGTVTVFTGDDSVEVTTFRKDGMYSDGRHPDCVIFSPRLEDDLARRDFTVNAMCIAEDESIIDLFGGQEDLRSGIIRAIGKADCRFSEDTLRILRALRFAAVLDFTVEQKTKAAMLRHCAQLSALSAERVRTELEKLLCAKACKKVMLEHRQIIFAVLPELRQVFLAEELRPARGGYCRAVSAVAAAPASLPIRLALLLCEQNSLSHKTKDGQPVGDTAKSVAVADGALRRLKFSNAVLKRVLFLVKYRNLPLCGADSIAMKKLLSAHGTDAMRDLFFMQRAYLTAKKSGVKRRLMALEDAGRLMESIIYSQSPLSLSQLAISGKELLALGIEPGPRLGGILELLLQKVIEQQLPNEPAALLKFAARQIKATVDG